MTDRTAGCDGLRRGDDRVRVDTVMPVKIGDRAGLAEMLDTQRPDLVAAHRAKPRQRSRMSVQDADDAAMRRQSGEQALDMRAGMDEAPLTCPACSRPAGIEAVGGGDGEQ